MKIHHSQFTTHNSNLPALRFPEFSEAGEWVEKKLGEICDINPRNEELPKSFFYIDLESVVAGELVSERKIDKQDAPSRAQRLLRNGDVIYQTVRPYQRNNFFCNFNDGNNYVASTGYAQLRSFGSSRFLYHLIHTDTFVKKVITKCTGSNYPAINSSDLAEIDVTIPKLAEQQKIAACLSSLDELITAHSQKLAALKKHKKGLMQQLFPAEGQTVPTLRFAEFRHDWEENILGFISNNISSGKDNNDPLGEYDLYGSTGIIGKTSSCTYNGKFILVARVGANAGLLTKVNGQFGVTDNTLVIQLKNIENIDTIFYYLDNLNLNRFIFGSGQPLITGGQLKSLKIYLPCDAEQQKIAACLSSLDELITAQSQKLAALKKHKKGLMQQLFVNYEL